MGISLLKEISDIPLYTTSLIDHAIRMGYPNKAILKAINDGIENEIKTYGNKLFASDGRLAFRKIYREELEKCKKLQTILNLDNLPDGKKLHNYLKAANFSTVSDLDIFISKLT